MTNKGSTISRGLGIRGTDAALIAAITDDVSSFPFGADTSAQTTKVLQFPEG